MIKTRIIPAVLAAAMIVSVGSAAMAAGHHKGKAEAGVSKEKMAEIRKECKASHDPKTDKAGYKACVKDAKKAAVAGEASHEAAPAAPAGEENNGEK